MSDIKIVPIGSTAEVVSPQLRERTIACGNLPSVRKFLARSATEELGLLCIDLRDQTFYIYEIYVIPRHRGAGIGTRLLEHGEELARESSCLRVGGKPIPLDDRTEQAWLVAWYEEHGYVASDSGCLMKPIRRLP